MANTEYIGATSWNINVWDFSKAPLQLVLVVGPKPDRGVDQPSGKWGIYEFRSEDKFR